MEDLYVVGVLVALVVVLMVLLRRKKPAPGGGPGGGPGDGDAPGCCYDVIGSDHAPAGDSSDCDLPSEYDPHPCSNLGRMGCCLAMSGQMDNTRKADCRRPSWFAPQACPGDDE